MKIFIILLLLSFSAMLFASQEQIQEINPIQPINEPTGVPENDWGLALGLRKASIPFETNENVVEDFVPRIYFESEYLFLRGDHGGVRFYQQETFSFSGIGRFRYFDIPADYQNKYQGTKIDVGMQFEYLFSEQVPLQIELMSDKEGNAYLNNRLSYQIETGNWDLDFNGNVRLKGSDFNDRYYGLEQIDIGRDYDLSIGTKTRYHVYSNLYLLAEANLTLLGANTRDSALMNASTQGDIFLGVGFFNDKRKADTVVLPDNHYIRSSFGWATPSNLGDIINFKSEKDEYNNRIASIFYGYPLADTLFSLPLEIYLTGGYGYHLKSEAQDQINELVVAVKLYYTFTWPIRWRFGAAEGLSYVNELPYIEAAEMEEKGYIGSHLMNYLDFSLDVNIGDLFRAPDLDKLWLGYGIHHRSAIFESSSMFGRIKGGSNYNTVYLQWHF